MPRPHSLSQFELFVLLALVREGGRAFGAELRRGIEQRSGRDASLGAIYTTLARLEDRGLVTHETTRPRPVQGGRSRKRFLISPRGEREARAAVRQLERMTEGLPWRTATATP